MTISGPASVNSSGSGNSGTYTATATYCDGSDATVPATWNVNSTTYASIGSTTGVLHPVSGAITSDQAVTVEASYTESGITENASMVVTLRFVPSQSSLVIAGPNSVPMYESATYTATAYYTDGRKLAVTPSWSLSDSTYASIDSNGNLTTLAVPSSQGITVNASYTDSSGNTLTGSSNVSIVYVAPPVLTGLSISGLDKSLCPYAVPMGGSAAYTATASYSDGSTSDVTPATTWSLSDTTYASINSTSGLLTVNSIANNVSSDQAVTVIAGYTQGGVTQTASYPVAIVYPRGWGQWTALGSGISVSPTVPLAALAVGPDGSLYAGGTFDASESISANIARWDPGTSTWSALGSGVSISNSSNPYLPAVLALAVGKNGNIYAAGSFDTAGNTSANNVAMWDPNTGAWSALGNGITLGSGYAVVSALAVDANGNLYAAGNFDTAGTASANNVAVWNGSTWSALGGGITLSGSGQSGASVSALAVDANGNVYAGGAFDTAGTASANNVAWWNTSTPGTGTWYALGDGISLSSGSAIVNALTIDANGNVYAGGSFDTAADASGADNNVAMWTPNTGTPGAGTWSALGTGIGPITLALAFGPDGYLYAGTPTVDQYGNPTSEGNAVYRWNGSSWTPMVTVSVTSLDVEGPPSVKVLARGNGTLYAGGLFDTIGGIAAGNVASMVFGSISGSISGPGAIGLNQTGAFTLPLTFYDGTPEPLTTTWSLWGNTYGASIDPATGVLTAQPVTANETVTVVATVTYDSGLTQTFTKTVTLSDNMTLNISGPSWVPMGSNWATYTATAGYNGGTPKTVRPTWSVLDKTYASINSSSGVLTANTVTTDQTVNVSASYPDQNRVTVTAPSQTVTIGFAYGVGLWSKLGSGITRVNSIGNVGIIDALAVDTTGNLYAGGLFNTSGSLAPANIAKWNGSTWSVLGKGISYTNPPAPGESADVFALAVDKNTNHLYAGGSFDTAGTASANNVAVWNGSAWSALGNGITFSNSNVPTVNALVVDASGNLYAAGYFDTAGGVSAANVAVWDYSTSTWVALGSGITFSNSNVPTVYALALDANGNLYAAGYFDTAGGNPAANIAVWTPTPGSPLGTGAWSALGNGISFSTGTATVYALTMDPTGVLLYAGGTFDTAGGNPAANIAMWDTGTTAWSALGSGISGSDASYPAVWTLASGPGGTLYAGGFPQVTTASPAYVGLKRTSSAKTASTSVASVSLPPAVGNAVYQWNGSEWVDMGTISATNPTVTALVRGKDVLYAGGTFDTIGNIAPSNIAAANLPTISIGAPSATKAAGGPITYTVTYTGASAVTLSSANITLNSTGTAGGTVSVTPGTTSNTRIVKISSITGNGTLGISIPPGTASNGVGFENTGAGPSKTFAVANVPTVSIGNPSVATTYGGPVTYTVTYTEATNVTLSTGNITLKPGSGSTATGTVSVIGTGNTTRTVTVSNVTGDGTLAISLAKGTATNAVGSSPAATSTTFTATNVPTVSIGAPSAASVKPGGSVTYTVTYTGASNIVLSNTNASTYIKLNKTGTAAGTTITVSGSGTSTRTVALSGITGDGTLGFSIQAGTASNLAGLEANGATSATFAVESAAPQISIGSPSVSPTTGGPVKYTVTYTEADSITLSTANITLNPGSGSTATGTVSVSGIGNTTRTVTISNITGSGTLAISIGKGTATNAAGSSPAATSTTFAATNVPTVSIGNPSAASVKPGGSATYTVTYTGASAVSLSTASNIAVNTGGSATGTVSKVTGSGNTWTVTVSVSSTSGNGTLGITIPAGTATNNNGEGICPASSPSTTFNVVSTAPTVSISAPLPASAASGSFIYTVTYTGADTISLSAAKITLIKTSTATANATVAVSVTGNTTRTVTVSNVSGGGTLGISIAAGTANNAAGGNAVTATSKNDNNMFTATNLPTVTVGAPSVASILSGGTVTYTVTYALEDPGSIKLDEISLNLVSGSITVDSSDISIAPGATANSRKVTISGITGSGTVGITIPAGTASNNNGLGECPASSPSATFNVVSSAPTVSIGDPSTSLGTSSLFTYTVTYTGEPDSITLSTSNITLNKSGTANGTISQVANGSTSNTRIVTISNVTGSGTLEISIPAGAVKNAFGKSAAATSPTFTATNVPTVSIGAPSPATPTKAGPVTYTVTYTGASAVSLSSGNIILNPVSNGNGTTPNATSITVSGSGTSTRTVKLSGITGDGTLGFSIPTGTASNASGPEANGGTSATFGVVNTAPTVSIGAPSASSTSTGPVTYTVTYTGVDDTFTTLSASNVTLNRTGTADGTVSVSGSGETVTVTVSSITGDGTLGITIPPGTASNLAGSDTRGAESSTFTVSNTGLTFGVPTFTSTTTDPDTGTEGGLIFTMVTVPPVAPTATGSGTEE